MRARGVGLALPFLLLGCVTVAQAKPAPLRIAGHVNYSGGPAGAKNLVARGLPVIVERGGKVIKQTYTGPHGNFRFTLPRGHYTVVAHYAFPPHEPCSSAWRTSRSGFAHLTCSIK
jgi:hypothetical protein